MGHMQGGVYHVEDDVAKTLPSGEFQRSKSAIRHWITPDGAPGPTGEGGFAAEVGRYHLYVAWNCPWAHRTLLARIFKRLDGPVSISVARPNRTDEGWVHDTGGEFGDPLMGVSALHEVYAADPEPYTGRVTVPLLWDNGQRRMVSNESADIVRMFNSAFTGLAPDAPDLYPAALRAQIDDWNERIYRTVNNGVYRAGFATTQAAYETAAREVFETLDAIDAHLADNRYLAGDVFTEADLRLFPTLVRFDVAYHYAFKCNLRRVSDYAYLWPYVREIYQMDGVADTVRFDTYKRGYFSANAKRNPLGIVPIGPALGTDIDWDEPHRRG